MNRPPPYIVSAAFLMDDGLIVAAPRHGCHIMQNLMFRLYPGEKPWPIKKQGFVDQYDKFYTREEAWKIADKNGQIRRLTGYEEMLDQPRPANVGDSQILFSENLY